MIKRAPRPSAAVPLTVARARLFRLVEDLLAGRTDRVALSHRAHDEAVLLVRASDVERLEAELAALRKRAAPEPRPLRGMATLLVPAEDVLTAIRAEQNALFEAKMRSIFDDPAETPAKRSAGAQSHSRRGAGAKRKGGKPRR